MYLLFFSLLTVMRATMDSTTSTPTLGLPAVKPNHPLRLPAGLESELYDDVSETVARLFNNMQRTTTYEGALSFLQHAVKQGYITQPHILLRALYLLERNHPSFLTGAQLREWAELCKISPAALSDARDVARQKYLSPEAVPSYAFPLLPPDIGDIIPAGASMPASIPAEVPVPVAIPVHLRYLPAEIEQDLILPTFSKRIVQLLTEMQKPKTRYTSPGGYLTEAFDHGVPITSEVLLRALYLIERQHDGPLSPSEFDLWARRCRMDPAELQHTVYAARHKYLPDVYPPLSFNYADQLEDAANHARALTARERFRLGYLPHTLENDLENPAYGEEIVKLLHDMQTYRVHNPSALEHAVENGLVPRADVLIRLLYLVERRRYSPFSTIELDLWARKCRINPKGVFAERQKAIDLYQKELQLAQLNPAPPFVPTVYESPPLTEARNTVEPTIEQPLTKAPPEVQAPVGLPVPAQQNKLPEKENALTSFMQAFGMMSGSLLVLYLAVVSPLLFAFFAPLAGLLYFSKDQQLNAQEALPEAAIDVEVVDVTDEKEPPTKKPTPVKQQVKPLPDIPTHLIPPFFNQLSEADMLRTAASYGVLSDVALREALPYAQEYEIPFTYTAHAPLPVQAYFMPPALRHPVGGEVLYANERRVYQIGGALKQKMLELYISETSLPTFTSNPLFYDICKQFMKQEAVLLLQGHKYEWVQQTLWGTEENYSAEKQATAMATALTAQQVTYLLQETLQIAENMLRLYKHTPDVESNLFTLHVYTGSFVCFFADLFTPAILLGEDFLKPFVKHLFKEAAFLPNNAEHYTDLFVEAYNTFVASLQFFTDKMDYPELVLYGYAKMLLDLIGFSHTGKDHALSVMNFTLDILNTCDVSLRMKNEELPA